MKNCSKCKQTLAIEEFGIDNSKRDGRSPSCKPCQRIRTRAYHASHREKRLADARAWKDRNPDKVKANKRTQTLRRYGLDEAGFQALLDSQDGKCAICRSSDPNGRNWSVDHNHDSGEVRAILCGSCNVLIGMAHEDSGVLRAAIHYLDKEQHMSKTFKVVNG
jgi:hypothetical protein